MSGRSLALALTLCLCCGLAAGCVAGPGVQPIFVTPPPASPRIGTPQTFVTSAPQMLPTAALQALAAATPQALPVAPSAEPTAPPALPAATPQVLSTAILPALPVAPSAEPSATPQALATARSQPVATLRAAAQTHVINVPGQPFAFRVPLGWTVQEAASIPTGMVLTADWTSPDNWDSPPPAGVIAHVVAVGAQAISADMSAADIAKAAQPDQLAAQLQAAMQDNCGPEGKLDKPLPIQIAGQPGMWIHCSTAINGRTMHLAAASAVHGRTTLAVMGLAVDPAPWPELAPIFEQIIKSVQATD